MEVNAEDLDNMVATLEGRLKSVTQPMFGRENGETKLSAPRPVLVPLAERIEQTVDRLRASVDRLRALNGAIELTE